ncbi:Uncharacterized protein TCM_034571 isoform 2 [Theobroma cacao]|uniref:Uncharacterized protein isoform 2 n=1 Tax=Theobroma cacao TaxID=3641 RepID=A0A061FF64_THECC|nr:Uncharacterized protein TCM_034571 isoform 2 [Theobroma cacao]
MPCVNLWFDYLSTYKLGKIKRHIVACLVLFCYLCICIYQGNFSVQYVP